MCPKYIEIESHLLVNGILQRFSLVNYKGVNTEFR